MNKFLTLIFFLTLSVNLFAQEIPVHLLRWDRDTVDIGQLIAVSVVDNGDSTTDTLYQPVRLYYKGGNTFVVGGDTTIVRSELQDTAAALRAYIDALPNGGTDDQTADEVSYDNTIAQIEGNPDNIQTAVDSINAKLDDDQYNFILFGNDTLANIAEVNEKLESNQRKFFHINKNDVVDYWSDSIETTTNRDAVFFDENKKAIWINGTLLGELGQNFGNITTFPAGANQTGFWMLSDTSQREDNNNAIKIFMHNTGVDPLLGELGDYNDFVINTERIGAGSNTYQGGLHGLGRNIFNSKANNKRFNGQNASMHFGFNGLNGDKNVSASFYFSPYDRYYHFNEANYNTPTDHLWYTGYSYESGDILINGSDKNNVVVFRANNSGIAGANEPEFIFSDTIGTQINDDSITWELIDIFNTSSKRTSIFEVGEEAPYPLDEKLRFVVNGNQAFLNANDTGIRWYRSDLTIPSLYKYAMAAPQDEVFSISANEGINQSAQTAEITLNTPTPTKLSIGENFHKYTDVAWLLNSKTDNNNDVIGDARGTQILRFFNSSPTIIEEIDGQTTQFLLIVSGNSNTTLKYDATKIVTCSGEDLTLEPNVTYLFTRGNTLATPFSEVCSSLAPSGIESVDAGRSITVDSSRIVNLARAQMITTNSTTIDPEVSRFVTTSINTASGTIALPNTANGEFVTIVNYNTTHPLAVTGSIRLSDCEGGQTTEASVQIPPGQFGYFAHFGNFWVGDVSGRCAEILTQNITTPITYDESNNYLYNNSGNALGINTTTPGYPFHVTNTSSQEFSAFFEKSNRKDFFIRNSSLYSGISNTTSSIAGTSVNLADEYIQLRAEQGSYNFFDNKLVFPSSSSDPSSLTAGTMWYNSTEDIFKYHDGTSTQSFGGGAASVPLLSEVLTAGNAAFDKITTLTAGTDDSDAANVGQTYFNISTTEDEANYKLGGATVYVKKLALSSITNASTLSFPASLAISGLNRLVDMNVNFDYDGGKQKAGSGDYVFGATTYVSVSEDAGIITMTNMSGFTLNNVDFYVYYTK